MTERLSEFNRLALKRSLQKVDEEQKLVLEVKELIQNAFHGRYLIF